MRNLRNAVVIKVIRTFTLEGAGKEPDDPMRVVDQYWSLEGELLATNDPYSLEQDALRGESPLTHP